MLTLQGRTCVFAGATGQVGKGAVKALANQGMNVVMITHNPDSAKEIMEELKDEKGQVVAYSDHQENVCDLIMEQFGSIDVIISNTGSFDAPVSFDRLEEKDLSKKLEHQVVGAFRMVKKYLPYLYNSKAARIILMASAGSQNGFEQENVFDNVARGAVISLTYTLAKMLASKNITVNCIAKSGIVNDHQQLHDKDLDTNSFVSQIPLKRIGSSDEFGALVQYLASEESGFMTGQVLSLSGGLKIG